jgi:hypothetical protein
MWLMLNDSSFNVKLKKLCHVELIMTCWIPSKGIGVRQIINCDRDCLVGGTQFCRDQRSIQFCEIFAAICFQEVSNHLNGPH